MRVISAVLLLLFWIGHHNRGTDCQLSEPVLLHQYYAIWYEWQANRKQLSQDLFFHEYTLLILEQSDGPLLRFFSGISTLRG